jgi:glucose-6-phosphate isomerase
MTMQVNDSSHELLNLLQINNKSQVKLREMLRSDPRRFDEFSRKFNGLLLDFSRTALDGATFSRLLELVELAGIRQQTERMFTGEVINLTENRAVLHHLWRGRSFSEALDDEEAVRCEQALVRLRQLADSLHSGVLPGDPDAPVTDIVHVGIGGSLIGPRLLCEAFPSADGVPAIHFISSVDAYERERLLTRLDPETTVIILVSKSFGTSEVLAHGRRLKQWMNAALGEQGTRDRLFAVSAAPEKAKAFGVPGSQILAMGEWTGGRYSLWSPVGFTIAISAGPESFERFCAGGAAMDEHFLSADASENLPIIHGLLSCWHRNACGHSSRGLIPYDSRLRGLPSWLQQLQMESNGKSVKQSGEAVSLDTSPIVLGDIGTDAQHALFQAFHQGTEVVPLDFVGVIRPDHDDLEAQSELLAHLLAQATALAFGRTEDETRDMMRREKKTDEQIETLLPHRIMPGNRPSIILMLDELTPENLGMLLVLYEHSVFIESLVWQINAFDQWGVELGKQLADQIQAAFAGEAEPGNREIASLGGLMLHIKQQQSSD